MVLVLVERIWKLNFKTTPEEEKPRNFLTKDPELEASASSAESLVTSLESAEASETVLLMVIKDERDRDRRDRSRSKDRKKKKSHHRHRSESSESAHAKKKGII